MRVLVIGLGYVGSIAVAGLAYAGHDVTGVDIDEKKVKAFSDGECPTYEPGLDDLIISGLHANKISFSHIRNITEADYPVIMLCIGTPSRADGAADLTQVKESLKWLRDKVVGPTIIVVKSTVPPGTGYRLINEFLTDWRVNVSYISNPEFLREGRAVYDWFNPDRIVIGGNDKNAVDIVKSLYNYIRVPFVITDVTSAELIKYAANAFLAMKISFINEIANLCEYLGGNIDAVASGIGYDKRIGPQFLKAGIGYGGSCFPKDVRALDYISMANGHNFELLKAVINVNNRQRILAVQKLRKVLGDLAGKIITILGLAFKPGTDDTREAPALNIIRMLIDEGVNVRVHDPIAIKNAKSLFKDDKPIFCEDLLDALKDAQAVIVATEWEEYISLDWDLIKNIMNQPYLIIDGRNCLMADDLISMGFVYYCIGCGVSAKDGIQNEKQRRKK